MHEKLEQIGLTKNESKIYLFLLQKGTSTTGPIIKNTKIANSQVYESINNLITKGLVTYNIQKDGKHFSAADPAKFKEIEEERMQRISTLIPMLTRQKSIFKEETTSAVYEGFEGFKTAFKKIIDDCPINGEIFILGFSEQQYASQSLRTFIKNMNLKSAQKKQRLRIVLDESTKKTLGKDREREKYSEIRYMPKGYISPASVDICLDYVYIFLWEEKPYVFMIKNQKLADSFRSYFEFLWKMSKS